MGHISDDALEVLKLMLKISAQKRGTAAQVLQLPFFAKDNLKTPSTQESRTKLSRDHSLKSPTANSQVMSILNKDRSSSNSNNGIGKM